MKVYCWTDGSHATASSYELVRFDYADLRLPDGRAWHVSGELLRETARREAVYRRDRSEPVAYAAATGTDQATLEPVGRRSYPLDALIEYGVLRGAVLDIEDCSYGGDFSTRVDGDGRLVLDGTSRLLGGCPERVSAHAGPADVATTVARKSRVDAALRALALLSPEERAEAVRRAGG